MEAFHNDPVDLKLYSPQALAFLGDAVYELMVRERLLKRANMPVGKLHDKAVEQVRASFQSKAFALLEEILDEEEMAVLKRGRNANCVKAPKNGNLADYRRATGVETLFGYLYLGGRIQRLGEIFSYIEEKLEP